jgi:nucleotide-binding universal stress UspA family protein
MLTIKNILVPIDFTETSNRALDAAVEFALKFEAKVTVLHAYEIPVFGFPDGALIATADITARITTAAQESLTAAIEARKSKGAQLEGMLRNGVAWEEIVNVADEIHADLIVIGTHGRRGLARALLGSVAENVIRTAKTPVLTIHGPRDEH